MFSVKTWDVIIVGAGIIGLSLAREFKKRNLRVLVVEKREPGREASHAAGGMLADCGDENPPQLQPLMTASARMYPEFVHELEDESGMNVDLRDAGTILLGSGSHRANTSTKALSKSYLANLEPNLVRVNLDATLVAERSVDPRALSSAALKACRHRDVHISSGDEVASVPVTNGRVTGVTTAKTAFSSAIVVNCAGAWSCDMGPYPVPTRPFKGQMLCVAMPSRNFLRHVVRSPEVYLIPRTDGRLLIGATVEDVGYDKRVVPNTIRQLRQSALNLMPGLSEARILEDWAGLRPGTPDGLPILGATPVPGYFVATGHFRDGILLAPITAKLITELIVDGKTGQDLSPFACGRFSDLQF
jgi:glycine oxidase